MSNDERYIRFSQRNGIRPLPSQLELGEVSEELRRLIEYTFAEAMEDNSRTAPYSTAGPCFSSDWKRVSKDFHVKFQGQSIQSYIQDPKRLKATLLGIITHGSIGELFDLVEFFVRHPSSGWRLQTELPDVFRQARAAYRIIGNEIVAIGTEQQGEAVEAAIANATAKGLDGAKRHLISAGKELRASNWSNSVRESIHAVEAVARKLAPGASTIGPALTALERQGHVHGSLKSAFNKLYGYTNDEHGIRHALSENEAQVDETDALFMLGACASFVSYLIARDRQINNVAD